MSLKSAQRSPTLLQSPTSVEISHPEDSNRRRNVLRGTTHLALVVCHVQSYRLRPGCPLGLVASGSSADPDQAGVVHDRTLWGGDHEHGSEP